MPRFTFDSDNLIIILFKENFLNLEGALLYFPVCCNLPQALKMKDSLLLTFNNIIYKFNWCLRGYLCLLYFIVNAFHLLVWQLGLKSDKRDFIIIFGGQYDLWDKDIVVHVKESSDSQYSRPLLLNVAIESAHCKCGKFVQGLGWVEDVLKA